MQNAIQEIIKKVPKGKIFDSHYVIDQLRSEYPDVYLTFASTGKSPQKKTNSVHGRIAKEIKKLSDLVVQVPGEYMSENIRGKASECAGWKKK
jgi:hypothetical protein